MKAHKVNETTVHSLVVNLVILTSIVFVLKKKNQSGALLYMIDNWGALHKDKKGQWINVVAQEKHVNYSYFVLTVGIF